MAQPDNILNFWLDEVGPKGWYEASDELDAAVSKKFGAAWENAAEGKYSLWMTHPSGTLAYLILTDQFPRNMFRGSGKAFSTDAAALATAKQAICQEWDLKIDEPARQFFYLPLMHSENLCDQDRCVRLMAERMPNAGDSTLFHARAHREVIRQFGRFPYRNAALGRHDTKAEAAYLAAGGYGHTVREMQRAEAA